MAATDITTNKDFDVNPRHVFHSHIKTVAKKIDGALSAGLWTVATHNIIQIPIGWALVGGYIVCTTTAAGATATLQVKISDTETLTGLLPVAALAKGEVFPFRSGAVSAVVGWTNAYAHTAAQTLDIAIATAALTAGVFVVVAELVDIKAITDQF